MQNLIRRVWGVVLRWALPADIYASITESKGDIAALQARIDVLEKTQEEYKTAKVQYHWAAHQVARALMAKAANQYKDTEMSEMLSDAVTLALGVQDDDTLVLVAASNSLPSIASYDPVRVTALLRDAQNRPAKAVLFSDTAPSRPVGDWLFEVLRTTPNLLSVILAGQSADMLHPPAYLDRLNSAVTHSKLIPFLAAAQSDPLPPFHAPEHYPLRAPAAAKRRSVVFLNNNYYHYNCLANGLRKRGWDAVTVSSLAPSDPQRQFMHGEDINLFDPDPVEMRAKATAFFKTVPERFGNVHFYGRGAATFFADQKHALGEGDPIPADFLELRRHSVLIGTMPSGCNDGAKQSEIWSQAHNLCDRCVWQLRPDVCNDVLNDTWNRRIQLFCDWIGLECDHQTPGRVGPKYVTDPIVTCLDPDRWRPDLEIPEEMRQARSDETVLIFHGVGNYKTRKTDGRDIKGSGAVFAAIETLKSEGFPVELIFAHDIESTKMRYLQVQADIVVDQLNYGRYGANARETLMLGRPTITRLIPEQAPGQPPQRAVLASPLVNGTEQTITDVLRTLVRDPAKRAELGAQSREFALKWHSQDVCAERFERFTDAIRSGVAPADVDVWPS